MSLTSRTTASLRSSTISNACRWLLIQLASVAFQQVFDVALDKGQRRAQLVRDVLHELVLETIQLAQLLVGVDSVSW